MTNVPNEIREMWADVYKLFDLNYNMTNDKDSWAKFWEQAEQIRQKHSDNYYIGSLILIVSEMLEGHMVDKKLYPCTLEDMKLF